MQRFINNFSTVLLAPLAVDGAALQIAEDQVARLTGLGGGSFYLLTLALVDSSGNEVAWEILRATAANGQAVSVQRGQEGTAPLDWAAGALVSARLTAGSLSGLLQGYADLASQVQGLAARVSALEGGGPETPPANALTNQAGEVLTNQAGDILTIGEQA